MGLEPDQLTGPQAAALTGLTPNSFRRYRSRGTAPPPDGRNGPTPWWWRTTILQWDTTRRHCKRHPKPTGE